MCQVQLGIENTAVIKPERVPGEDAVLLQPDPLPPKNWGACSPNQDLKDESPPSDAIG